MRNTVHQVVQQCQSTAKQFTAKNKPVDVFASQTGSHKSLVCTTFLYQAPERQKLCPCMQFHMTMLLDDDSKACE